MTKRQPTTRFLSSHTAARVTTGHDIVANLKQSRGTPPRKTVFSSDDLPEGLDDRARFLLWRDLYTASFGSFDLSCSDDSPFSIHSEWTRFGAITVSQCSGTISRVGRTSRGIAVDGDDSFSLSLNCGQSRIAVNQSGREAVLEGGMGTLLVASEPGEVQSRPHRRRISVLMPRKALVELVADAEDLIAKPIGPNSFAMRHLPRYLGILLGPDDAWGGPWDDPALIDHVETTVLDLAALALGAGRDAIEIASMRGLRAARTQEILAKIRKGFTDAAASPHTLARELGLSARYVQDLLQETGLGFTERVLELRLQKAREMLADPRHDRSRISEIVYACGFSEVSYFNRRFRRRFGDSPKAFRGRKAERPI